jgi:rubrerythrin
VTYDPELDESDDWECPVCGALNLGWGDDCELCGFHPDDVDGDDGDDDE